MLIGWVCCDEVAIPGVVAGDVPGVVVEVTTLLNPLDALSCAILSEQSVVSKVATGGEVGVKKKGKPIML